MSTEPAPSDRRRSALHLRAHATPSVPGYHVLERIGLGRRSAVFRAIQLSMQREVALRVLDAALGRVAGFPERFMQEARSAGAVHHPNVVSCYDVGQGDGLLYQAMELISGKSLGQVRALHARGLPAAHAIGILVEAARGLEGIHRSGLVHGDLRLGNLFITDDEVVKLADFAMVRSREVLRAEDEGQALAELATLAPEQFVTGGRIDIRADLYALGAILFVLLTGQQPFTGRTRRELERHIANLPVPDARSLVPGVTADLMGVIAKAMSKDPAQRYATPGQLREDLERVQYDFVPIHALPLTTGGEHPPTPMPTPAHEAVSPTRTIAKDASFLLVPRAQEHRRDWRLPGLAGMAVLAGLTWWLARATVNTVAPATGATDGATTSRAPGASPPADHPAPVAAQGPAWAAACGSDAHGRWADLSTRGTTLRLRSIPAGHFVMGSLDTDPAHRADEQAVVVTLSHGWWMGESEVTQAQYQAVTGDRPSGFHGDRLPVENVTWNASVAFTRRLNALVPGLRSRLPSEAEWEYACRAGDDANAPAKPASGWFSGPEVTASQPVMGLPANAWGLYDMQGNVMEWCEDLYGPYPTQPAVDPLQLEGVSRVVRGGSWAVDAVEGRAATRGKYLPVAHHAHIGFRVVIDE